MIILRRVRMKRDVGVDVNLFHCVCSSVHVREIARTVAIVCMFLIGRIHVWTPRGLKTETTAFR